MAQVSTIVRNFVIDRLLDDSNGFNYWLNIAATDPVYENAGGAFTLAERTNLFRGYYTHKQLLGTFNTPSYPLVIVYSLDESTPSLIPGTNLTPDEFTGPVRTRMDWIAGFDTSAPPVDPDSTLDMIQDALLETFNRQDYYGLTPPGTMYNNEIISARGGLNDQEGPNWVQLYRWEILFRQLSSGR